MADKKAKSYQEKFESGVKDESLTAKGEKIKEGLKRLLPFGNSASASDAPSQPAGQYENKKPRGYGGRY